MADQATIDEAWESYVPRIECWQCGGDGEIASCWEEFACIDPESGCADCLRRCDICEGKGSWIDPEFAEDSDG